MLIRTCNAMKTNHSDQLHVQHTTNAKYMKYMHLRYKILHGYKCEILKIYVRLNLINHFVGFISCQFACNLAFRNPIFRWESCKGSVWESVNKSSKVCNSAGPCNWLTACKSPKQAHVWSMQGSWRVTPTVALQDKSSSLARQLAHNSDSRLSQVARPSC